jgi:Zn-dependent metalloprotease
MKGAAMRTRPQPIACILPPDILERIALHGDEQQRAAAIRTLARDASLRAIRAQNAILRAQGGRQLRAHVAEGGTVLRTILDCEHSEDPARARIVRNEGDTQPTGDLSVNEAYDGLGETYRLYWEVFERDSIDGEGMPLQGYIHYGEAYDNAFWDGRQMVFGDGDGRLFNRFTAAVDVIGHELTHGVTEDEAQLVYFRQSGALNESISDVFGSLVKQYTLAQKADEADWLIGAGLIADTPEQALRSMKRPGTAYDHPLLGKDNQPSHMDGYVRTTTDNGGVHLNSGIPNHAFYLASSKLGGHAWDAAGKIWYETLRDPLLRPTAMFRTFARATLRAAQRLGYLPGSTEHDAVKEAWAEVGLAV